MFVYFHHSTTCTVLQYVSPDLEGNGDGRFAFASPQSATAYLRHMSFMLFQNSQQKAITDNDSYFGKDSSFCAIRIPGYNNRFKVVATYYR